MLSPLCSLFIPFPQISSLWPSSLFISPCPCAPLSCLSFSFSSFYSSSSSSPLPMPLPFLLLLPPPSSLPNSSIYIQTVLPLSNFFLCNLIYTLFFVGTPSFPLRGLFELFLIYIPF
uniref:Uncharacterized protein n=1 Tax=Cacopsylla melanoneura TaxID=428564 RepID=A0A8D8Z0N1_9HEMI